jgi:hypothetical protein
MGLPDRVFFAGGACHILAFAFLEQIEQCTGRRTMHVAEAVAESMRAHTACHE